MARKIRSLANALKAYFGVKRQPRLVRLALYGPRKGCKEMFMLTQENRALSARPGIERAAETHVCRWQVQECARPCGSRCGCIVLRSQCPPKPTLRQKVLRGVHIAAIATVVKLAYDAGIWKDRAGAESLDQSIGAKIGGLFPVVRPDLRTDEEKYDMARRQYNLASAWNNCVKRTVRALEALLGLVGGAVHDKLVAPGVKREETSAALEDKEERSGCWEPQERPSSYQPGTKRVTFFNPQCNRDASTSARSSPNHKPQSPFENLALTDQEFETDRWPLFLLFLNTI
ncbi:hypothetical protein AAG570_007714 [Ranatra chinensis]|uniref:MICOS complex subunit MIC13 n=1 Tax=Ranatra chinensis TaxID=642074 RepID=A0ABD0YI75_9HEMI